MELQTCFVANFVWIHEINAVDKNNDYNIHSFTIVDHPTKQI